MIFKEGLAKVCNELLWFKKSNFTAFVSVIWFFKKELLERCIEQK